MRRTPPGPSRRGTSWPSWAAVSNCCPPPPPQRDVLDLRMNHGLSHAEVGAMLEISEESSRANYYHALRRLRAEFEAQEGDPR